MSLALFIAAVVLSMLGGAYEVGLLQTSRHRLAEAVSRRLRGGDAPLEWPAAVARELTAASATMSLSVILAGATLPALFADRGGWLLLVALVLLGLLVIVGGGFVLPRWIRGTRGERLTRIVAPLFRPWSALLGLVLPAFGRSPADLRPVARDDALLLPELDEEMTTVGGVITFAHRPVRDVMTPRTDIVALPEGSELAEIRRVFAESGYSRIPVFRETLDDITGMVHAFDLFTLRAGEALPVRPVALAPSSRSCGDLLVDMQRERRHLAVVLDEFGGTLGIVTLGDLLSALVGEIFDEGPGGPAAAAELALLEADGSQAVSEIEERFDIRLPPGHAATIGGRLTELGGRIPVTGERLVLGQLEVDILQASPTRVERVVLRRGIPVVRAIPETPR